jgi:hypothetical protein
MELFETVAAEVPIRAGPVVIADYGASNVQDALRPIGAGIAVLRKRFRSDHVVMVVHADSPENDFTALFRTLDHHPDSYLRADDATFASAIGRSYYTQILPSNTITLGCTFSALQWPSRVLVPVPDHIHVAYSRDEAVRAAYAKQAAFDWHEFAAFRGRELVPGGRLVVVTPAIDEDGEFGYRPLLSSIWETLTELTADGLLSSGEADRMTIPTVGRRAGDFAAPFAPSGRFEQLTIEHLSVVNAPDRIWERFQADRDSAAFGAQWAAFGRSRLFAPLTAGLVGGREDPRRGQLLDRLQAGVAARLAAAPEPTRIPMAQLVLAKRTG